MNKPVVKNWLKYCLSIGAMSGMLILGSCGDSDERRAEREADDVEDIELAEGGEAEVEREYERTSDVPETTTETESEVATENQALAEGDNVGDEMTEGYEPTATVPASERETEVAATETQAGSEETEAVAAETETTTEEDAIAAGATEDEAIAAETEAATEESEAIAAETEAETQESEAVLAETESQQQEQQLAAQTEEQPEAEEQTGEQGIERMNVSAEGEDLKAEYMSLNEQEKLLEEQKAADEAITEALRDAEGEEVEGTEETQAAEDTEAATEVENMEDTEAIDEAENAEDMEGMEAETQDMEDTENLDEAEQPETEVQMEGIEDTEAQEQELEDVEAQEQEMENTEDTGVNAEMDEGEIEAEDTGDEAVEGMDAPEEEEANAEETSGYYDRVYEDIEDANLRTELMDYERERNERRASMIGEFDNERNAYVAVEEDARPTEGHDALIDYLEDEIEYPVDAQAAEMEGVMFVEFVVDEQGNVRDPKVVHNTVESQAQETVVDPRNPNAVTEEDSETALQEMEEEAIRAVETTSGMWQAARLEGKEVPVIMEVPVRFRIADSDGSINDEGDNR